MDARRRMSVLAGGFAASQMLYVAARLDLAEALAAGPLPIEELGARCGARPEALLRIVRALAAFGVFELSATNVVSNSPLSELLRAGADDSMRHVALLYGDEHYVAMSELLQAVQRGGTAFEHAYRKPHFSYLASNPEAASAFYGAEAAARRRTAREIVRAHDFGVAATVVEVAGGSGEVIRAVLHANPALRGVLAEAPGLARRARARIHGDGLAERCDVEACDVFESVPPGGDVYVLAHAVHGVDDDHAVRLLRNCARAMAEAGRVLVVERLLPDTAHQSVEAQESFLHDAVALAISGGRTRTLEELRSLIAAAQLRVIECTAFESGDCMLIAARD
jgi:SAM-dependent methyltransferase